MSYIYVTEQGSSLQYRANKVILENLKKEIKEIPVELVEGVVVFGNINLTTPFLQEMLKRDIPITFLSTTGAFFGKLESTMHMNVVKQAHQFKVLYDKKFCLELSKKIIDAKVNNQIVILRRYVRKNEDEQIEDNIRKMLLFKEKIPEADTVEGLMGFEGIIARNYFFALASMVPKEFYFSGRSKRPPKDPFNSLLSLGYSLLIYEIYNSLVIAGLNPYLAFFHKVRNRHPALASDLIEELRAPLIDSLCLSILNQKILKIDDFTPDKNHNAIYLDKKAIKLFISKYEEKIRTKNNYYAFSDSEGLDYRKAIHKQINSYYEAVKEKDLSLYNPLIIR